MATVGFINRIDGEHPDAVDAERVEGSGRSYHFKNFGLGNSEGLR